MLMFLIVTVVTAVVLWRHARWCRSRWWEFLLLAAWGLLAATTPAGHVPAGWLGSISGHLSHWVMAGFDHARTAIDHTGTGRAPRR